jgi:hypothetical protein
MFIATQLTLISSAKSENAEHFALCGRSAKDRVLSINIKCLRHVSVPIRRAMTLEAKLKLRSLSQGWVLSLTVSVDHERLGGLRSSKSLFKV